MLCHCCMWAWLVIQPHLHVDQVGVIVSLQQPEAPPEVDQRKRGCCTLPSSQRRACDMWMFRWYHQIVSPNNTWFHCGTTKTTPTWDQLGNIVWSQVNCGRCGMSDVMKMTSCLVQGVNVLINTNVIELSLPFCLLLSLVTLEQLLTVSIQIQLLYPLTPQLIRCVFVLWYWCFFGVDFCYLTILWRHVSFAGRVVCVCVCAKLYSKL